MPRRARFIEGKPDPAPDRIPADRIRRGRSVSWTCHVCGDTRPDAKISVRSSRQELRGGVVVQHNVRYCNDREACVLGSRETLSVFERKLAPNDRRSRQFDALTGTFETPRDEDRVS